MLCHLDSQWTVVLCLPGGRIALLILLWKFSKYIPLASSSQTISKDIDLHNVCSIQVCHQKMHEQVSPSSKCNKLTKSLKLEISNTHQSSPPTYLPSASPRCHPAPGMLGKSKSLKDDTGMIVADGHLEEDRELIALEQYMGDARVATGDGYGRVGGTSAMSTLMIKAFLFMYPLLECNWELYRVWGQMLPILAGGGRRTARQTTRHHDIMPTKKQHRKT